MTNINSIMMPFKKFVEGKGIIYSEDNSQDLKTTFSVDDTEFNALKDFMLLRFLK